MESGPLALRRDRAEMRLRFDAEVHELELGNRPLGEMGGKRPSRAGDQPHGLLGPGGERRRPAVASELGLAHGLSLRTSRFARSRGMPLAGEAPIQR